MTIAIAIDDSQRKAALVVGIAYLVAMVASIFAEGYVRGTLIVGSDAAATARNIMANTGLFRLGIASNLIVFIADVVLITALYVILERVNQHLALLAVCFRLIETAILVVGTLNDLDVLRILSGAEYLQMFDADRLAVLARLSIGTHSSAVALAFVFLGLGSTVFGYLWYQSAYVPRAWGVLGVFASALLGAGAFAMLIVPSLGRMLYPAYMVPMFFLEVGLGVWLLVKGLRPPAGEPPAAVNAGTA